MLLQESPAINTTFLSNISNAQSQKKIVIKGNEYIDDEVIYSIIGDEFNLDSDSDKNKNKSIFPFWFILFIVGILIYLTITILFELKI